MKKAIVTGANGFVGRYLQKELKQKNYYVVSVIKDENEDINCIIDYTDEIVYCDLSNISKLDDFVKKNDYEAFYHLAWIGSSGDGRKDYSLQLFNAKACADAAEVAYRLGCKRFIGAGSVTELMYEDYLKLDESDPEMVACYAVGKIAAEYMSKCVCTNNGIDFLWGYISNFYGAEDKTQNFINFLIDNYERNNVPILTEGNQKADFMYVSDVARALILMAESGKRNSSYYIGYGDPKPLKEYVIKIRDILNPNLESGLGKKPFRGLDIDFNKLDYKKLKQDTGFVPNVTFEEGIIRTLEWRRNNETIN